MSDLTATTPLTPAQESTVYQPDQPWSDDFALKVAVQDFNRAESYRTSNHDWRWAEHNRLYQATVEQKFWEGTRIPRSSLPIFLSFEQIESMLPKILSAIFSDNPWFQVDPEPGTTADEARSARDILIRQLDNANVREVLRQWIKSGLQYGNGIFELSWIQKKTTRKKYVSKFEAQYKKGQMIDPATGQPAQAFTGYKRILEQKEFDELDNHPMLENILIEDFYIDPNCSTPQPQSGRYVATRKLMAVDEADALRENKLFNIPPKDILIEMAKHKTATQGDITKKSSETARQGYYNPGMDQTVDPGGKRLEVIRYCTADRWVYVFNREHVAYNEANPYGFIPFYCFPYADVLGRFYAMGMCDVLEGEQRFRTSLRNGRVDEIALNIHRPMIKRRGMTLPNYQMRQTPGRVWEVENPKEDLIFPEQPNILQNAYIEDQFSSAEAQKVTGMSDLAVLGTPGAGGNSASRTATGVGVQAQASFSRIQYLVENAEDLGIEPMLTDLWKLNQLYPPIKDMAVPIPGQEGKSYNVPPELIINSNVKFKMRASAKMQAKMALLQSFPLVLQTLANPVFMQQLAQQGEAIDFSEIVSMLLDMTGYKNRGDIIRKLTPQEKQSMNQPPQQDMIRMQMQRERLQSQQQTTQQKMQADQQMTQDQQQHELVQSITEKAMEAALQQEEPQRVQ